MTSPYLEFMAVILFWLLAAGVISLIGSFFSRIMRRLLILCVICGILWLPALLIGLLVEAATA